MCEALQGHLNGQYQGKPNRVSFSRLEMGDVLLCHDRNGGYGYWTHAVVYVGHGEVVDAYNFLTGTALYPIQKYRYYDEVCVLRAKASPQVRERVAAYALAAVGKPYDPFGSLLDARSEYCSKLVWQAHRAAGIPLCPATAWVLPDDLSASKQMAVVAK